MSMAIIKRICDLREAAKLSQRELGECLNLPQRTYAYYETGERTVPPEVLIKLTAYYHTSVDFILGLTDQPACYPRGKKRVL